MYQITNTDKYLVLQPIVQLRIRIEVLNTEDEIVDTIEGGIVSGTSSIDAESDIRRTCSLTILPIKKIRLTIGEDGIIWLNKKIHIYIGIKNVRTDEYTYWSQGIYVFMNSSATYDSTTNQIQLECSDQMAYLDGTRSGNLGQKEIDFPAYEEDETTGEPIKYNYIREAMITALTQLGRIKEYNIEWIGEAKAQPGYAKDWDYLAYRETTLIPGTDGNMYYQCFAIPYDLEFTSDATVLSVLTEMRDLYENYEMYFDEDGVFCCKMIPSGDNDQIFFDNSFLSKILISEDTSIDFTEVKNVTEAWGQCFEPDWYTDAGVTYANNTYTATIDGYTDDDNNKYSNGDEFALLIPTTNSAGCYVNLNSLGAIQVYNENTEEPIEAGAMLANTVYDFKIKKRYDSSTKTNVIKAYLQGNWEVHAIEVLTDGTTGENYTSTSGVTAPVYSEAYFKTVYNCNNVHLTTIKDSPFTVQKLGVLLNVYTNEDMTSDALGLEGAKQENYRTCRLTDNITITTKICPFADVNQKVKYKRSDKDVEEEYLVKKLDHDWSAGTTTWNLVRYYQLYIDD